MVSFDFHHSFKVEPIFDVAVGLHQNAVGAVFQLFRTGFQRAAAGRAAPTFSVLAAGIDGAHIPDFGFQFNGGYIQRCPGGKAGFFCHLYCNVDTFTLSAAIIEELLVFLCVGIEQSQFLCIQQVIAMLRLVKQFFGQFRCVHVP